GAESELVSVVGRETILREAIEPIRDDYDFLIIDCPPSLGLLSLNALAAVDEVLIPIQPHFLALQGFGQLLQTVSLVSKRINPALKISAILLCMFDSRVTLSAEVKADIAQFLESARDSDCPWSDAKIVPVYIRRNIKLAEAPSYGKTIFEYEPNCNGAIDYQLVADFLCGRIKEKVVVEDIVEELDKDEVEDVEIAAAKLVDDATEIASENAAPIPIQSIGTKPCNEVAEHVKDDAGDVQAGAGADSL
ncbi:MAG: AAA family ATPase, partial [Anaerohalosphaera sp.]|nr:AAA family ATPase [Anaerohalosphaera sp.]